MLPEATKAAIVAMVHLNFTEWLNRLQTGGRLIPYFSISELAPSFSRICAN